MSNDFTSFFGNPSTMPNTTPTSFNPGYFTNNMELLFQGMSRQQTANQNTLLNYTTVQSDKNFNLTTIQKELTTLTGSLGVSTQMAKSTGAQTQVMQVQEYNPTSFQNSLFNQQSLLGTNTNFLSSVQQGQTSKSLSSGFGSDLSGLFTKGILTLATLASIALVVEKAFATVPSVPNTAITNTLSTNLGTYANDPLTNSTSSVQFQDSMFNSGMTQTQINTATTNINNFLNTQSTATIATMVTPTNYQNVNITLADPIGINVATALNTEIGTTFSNNLTTFINSQNLANGAELTTIINTAFTTNIASSISNALPSMSAIANGVIAESSNILSADMNAQFNNVVTSILTAFGVIVPIGSNLTPFDALYNLHRNIEIRNNLLQTGGTISQIANLDTAVSAYFVAGSFNATTLANLEQQLSEFVGS